MVINVLFYNDLYIPQLREKDIILRDLFDKEDSDNKIRLKFVNIIYTEHEQYPHIIVLC